MTQPVFDAHLHIIDPAHPLVENNGFLPEPFTVADYRARIGGLGVAGGAVVSGSFQAFDQGYLIDALRALGPTYVGVTQIPAETSDQQILDLHEDGLPSLLRLVEHGVKVKATGFGRVELDPVATIKAIMDVDPTALMIGTDLPSTRARRPFEDQDFELIAQALDPSQVADVFWNNASAFYLG